MSKIEGVAQRYDGLPVDYVSIFQWVDGKCIAQIPPDENGSWSYEYFTDLNIGITYISNGCEPLTHGGYVFTADPSPFSLFSNNERGAWYDPSDLSTLYKDINGDIPVTSNGDAVALVLDKSGNGNHIRQAILSKRPIYKTDGSLHWLEFDGDDDSMITGALPSSYDDDNLTMWVGAKGEAATKTNVLVGKNPHNVEFLIGAYTKDSPSDIINNMVGEATDTYINAVKLIPFVRSNLYNKALSPMVFRLSNIFTGRDWRSGFAFSGFTGAPYKGRMYQWVFAQTPSQEVVSKIDEFVAVKAGATLA